MARVTIETNELTLSATSTDETHIEAWHVVQLIKRLVEAMEAAAPKDQYYDVRLNLRTELKRTQ